MKQKLVMTKGLPASGKSKWAKEYCKNHHNFKRINNDDLRMMFDNGAYSKEREKFISKIRKGLILDTLDAGYSVIVDNTNLHPKHELALKDLAEVNDVDFEVKDFLHVPLDVCIERDLARDDQSVGKKVILDMYYRYIHKEVPWEFNHQPMAVIFDIDGTLACRTDRSPFDMTKVDQDVPNGNIMHLFEHYVIDKAVKVFVFSGRDESAREKTINWIQKHSWFVEGYDYTLHMRKEGDNRRDSVIKEELYREHIDGKYQVLFVVDDRRQVVDMWRRIGLTCLEVADHRF